MADDDQAPVQVVMDGQEQEVFLKDVHPLAYTKSEKWPAHGCRSYAWKMQIAVHQDS